MRVPASSPLGAALAYAAAGWPVLPLRGKAPITRHGLHDASTDPAVIAAWWRLNPGARLALAVPPGYAVIDVDDFDAFERIEAAGLRLPTTLTAASPRGQHFYYRTRRDMHPAAGILPGVDVRAHGSYVVAPPTPGYRWLVVAPVVRLD